MQSQVAMDPTSYSEKRTRPTLEQRLESIISGAAQLADSMSTRDDTRDKIIASCNGVRQALQDLLSEYMNHVRTILYSYLFHFLALISTLNWYSWMQHCRMPEIFRLLILNFAYIVTRCNEGWVQISFYFCLDHLETFIRNSDDENDATCRSNIFLKFTWNLKSWVEELAALYLQ